MKLVLDLWLSRTVRTAGTGSIWNICSGIWKKDHKFACLNVFQIIIDMLNERGLFERVCQQEVKVGTETLKKQLAGPLNQKRSLIL